MSTATIVAVPAWSHRSGKAMPFERPTRGLGSGVCRGECELELRIQIPLQVRGPCLCVTECHSHRMQFARTIGGNGRVGWSSSSFFAKVEELPIPLFFALHCSLSAGREEAGEEAAKHRFVGHHAARAIWAHADCR